MPETSPRFLPADALDGGLSRGLWSAYLGVPEQTVVARHEACAQYVEAAQQLLEVPVSPFRADLGNPVCFLIRHAIELAIKMVVRVEDSQEPGHELFNRLGELQKRAEAQGLTVPPEFVELVQEFASVDPGGMGFRYAADSRPAVYYVAVEQLRRDVAVLEETVNGLLRELAERVHGGPGVEWDDD